MVSDEVLNRLLQRREQLRARMQRVRADQRREAEPLSADFEEQATQREGDEVLDRVGLSAQQEMQQIDAALLRLRAGSYGTCERCGQAIEPARLQIVPQAVRCSRCSAEQSTTRA